MTITIDKRCAELADAALRMSRVAQNSLCQRDYIPLLFIGIANRVIAIRTREQERHELAECAAERAHNEGETFN